MPQLGKSMEPVTTQEKTFLFDKFPNRSFFIQHITPYEYVKQFSKDKVILDAGSSRGYGAFCLSAVAKMVVGIDLDPAEIKKAQQAYSRDNLKYLVNNVLDIQFPDEHFDIVISSQVVEHIELDKLDTYLSEIYRVLKKDGIFFVNTLNLLSNLKKRSLAEYDKCPQHIKEFTSDELERFLLSRFPKVEILGLRRGFRHKLCHIFKKSGLFKHLPAKFNIPKSFYENKITTSDFRYSSFGLDKSIDLLAICRKS